MLPMRRLLLVLVMAVTACGPSRPATAAAPSTTPAQDSAVALIDATRRATVSASSW
jgi:hypothetical protein